MTKTKKQDESLPSPRITNHGAEAWFRGFHGIDFCPACGSTGSLVLELGSPMAIRCANDDCHLELRGPQAIEKIIAQFKCVAEFIAENAGPAVRQHAASEFAVETVDSWIKLLEWLEPRVLKHR